MVDVADDRLLIDEVIHRLAHLHVVVGRQRVVDHHPHGLVAANGDAARIGIIRERHDLVRRQALGHVHLALLEQRDAIGRFRHHQIDDALDLRRAAPVVLVGLHDDPLAGGPLGHPVAAEAAAVGRDPLVAPGVFLRGVAHDLGRVEPGIVVVGQPLAGERHGPGRGELDRIIVDLRVAPALRRVDGLARHAEQKLEEVVDRLRGLAALDPPQHVVGGELVAPGRDHALAQVVDGAQAVLVHVALLDDARHQGLLAHVVGILEARDGGGIPSVACREGEVNRLPVHPVLEHLRAHAPGLRAHMLVEVDALRQGADGDHHRVLICGCRFRRRRCHQRDKRCRGRDREAASRDVTHGHVVSPQSPFAPQGRRALTRTSPRADIRRKLEQALVQISAGSVPGRRVPHHARRLATPKPARPPSRPRRRPSAGRPNNGPPPPPATVAPHPGRRPRGSGSGRRAGIRASD